VPSPQAPDWAQPRAERHLFRPRARRPAGAIRGAAACRDGWRPPILRPEDSVEETWRVVQPLLDHPPDVRPARAGPGDLRRPKTCSAAARAGSSRGCPRRA